MAINALTEKCVKNRFRAEDKFQDLPKINFHDLPTIKRPTRADFALFDRMSSLSIWINDGPISVFCIPRSALTRKELLPSAMAKELAKRFKLSLRRVGNLVFLESKDSWVGEQAAAALTFSVFDRRSIHVVADGGNA